MPDAAKQARLALVVAEDEVGIAVAIEIEIDGPLARVVDRAATIVTGRDRIGAASHSGEAVRAERVLVKFGVYSSRGRIDTENSSAVDASSVDDASRTAHSMSEKRRRSERRVVEGTALSDGQATRPRNAAEKSGHRR